MKQLKRILTLAVILALCLSLAACGGNTGKNNSGGNAGSSADNGSSTGSTEPDNTAPPADLYVYAPEFIPVAYTGRNGINGLTAAGDRFLTTIYEVTGNNAPEGTPEEEVQYYDTYESVFCWLGVDGSLTRLENYKNIEAPDTENDETVVSSYAGCERWKVLDNGSLLTIDNVFTQRYTGPADPPLYSEEWWNLGYYEEYMHEENQYILRTLAQDGSELTRVSLDELSAAVKERAGYFSTYNMQLDHQDRLYFTSDTCILVAGLDGKLIKTVELPQDCYVQTLVKLKDGMGICYYADGKGMVMARLDGETLTLDTENTSSISNVWDTFEGAGEYDFYYTNGSNLMGYKAETGTDERVLNWVNCDVNPNNVYNGCVLEDGRVAMVETSWNDDYTEATSQLVLLTKVPAASLEQKKQITLATEYLNYDVQEAIIKFNRSSPNSRIHVLDYSEYNTEEDYSAGLTKLNAEIMAGKVPDILDLNGLNYTQLSSLGLLVDLKPLLDSDPELQGKLRQNVMDLFTVNGKLCRTISSFDIFTAVGAASVVGDTPGWTLQEFKTALSNMPEGCTPFSEGVTRDTVLNWYLNMSMDYLIDWNTGKCRFDSEAFVDMLKFANEFPKEYIWDEDYVWSDEDSDQNRIATGRQMLMTQWFYDFESFQFCDALFGNDACCIGFPVSEGVGSALSLADSGYAISTKSPHQDEAWAFLRRFFTADYQTNHTYGFPTNLDAMEKKIQEVTTPQYYTNPDGSYMLDENGEPIEMDRGTWGMGGFEYEIKAMTREQVDEILRMIDSIDRVFSYDIDAELYTMITGDTEAYFSGQKTAEEVAKLVQSKMTIYVNERR